MTNRERVLAAIRFEPKDFTPHDITLTTQMREKLIAYTGDPQCLERFHNHIHLEYLDKPQTPVPGRSGCFQDEYGVVWNKNGADKDIGVIDGVQISSWEDLERYTFPPVDEAHIRRLCRKAQEDRERFTGAAIGFSLFERAWTLMGMEDLLCNMIAEPELVHGLLRRICDRNLAVLDIALEYDLDCFHFGDDWGQQRGLIMGPVYWRRFIGLTWRSCTPKSAGRARWYPSTPAGISAR